MAEGTQHRRAPTPREIAQARERFLTDGDLPLDGLITPAIRDSWRRSALHRVGADHVEPAYSELPEALPRFAVEAARVLDRTTELLGTEPVSLVLTDAEGTVLMRWTGERALQAHLDAVSLAPGFRYSEGAVGTNGIGTALERGVPTLVHGNEHFTTDLVQFSCAGAPIRDPVTGAVLGVVDLTSFSGRGTHLMLGFVRSIARQVEDLLRPPPSTASPPLPAGGPPAGPLTAPHRLTPLESLERDAIVAALAAHGGRRDEAALALGISRATLYRRLRNYGISAPSEGATP